MILFLPKYRPVLRKIAPTKNSVQIWIENMCEKFRGCFDCTDWSVFTEACETVNELNECVCEYIKFCEDLIVKKKEVTVYPNNKPWVTKEMKKILNEKKYIFKIADKALLKEKQKELKKVINKCRANYKKKIETHFKSGDIKKTWDGLKLAVNYTQKKGSIPDQFDSNDLNDFYARFDTDNNTDRVEQLWDRLEDERMAEAMIEFDESEIKNVFVKINEKKAAGSDGMNGKLLKVCADELSFIYTYLFNMSLFLNQIPVIW
ncbi:hypothetical protein ElyMa_004740600 [Elysia marginata]|uniref:Reverse transcriptase domain-containing protein n=1 Tax=Elysia marginata TaxID=1093978 RepID=A0AAV4IFG8_9GAST|nr:hypothetical protein ElyMa_004740600 [Elysia marginata]